MLQAKANNNFQGQGQWLRELGQDQPCQVSKASTFLCLSVLRKFSQYPSFKTSQDKRLLQLWQPRSWIGIG